MRQSSQQDNIRINHRIRAREVRVIGPTGAQLGVMDLRKALEAAQGYGLDLAEISPTSTPPVCKILDYGKYKYELKKKAKQAKKKQAVTLLKEVQFRPQTDTHDVNFKVKHILRFLDEGNKVKVAVKFRGREATHANLGYALLKQIIDMVGVSGIIEQSAKMEGRMLSLIIAPNTKAGKKAARSGVRSSSGDGTDKPHPETSTGPQVGNVGRSVEMVVGEPIKPN